MATMAKKETFPDITPCKFAKDEADEFCAKCDGVVMTVDGKKYSCKDCQGYAEPEPVKEGPAAVTIPDEETIEEVETLPPVDAYQTQAVTTAIKAESGLSVELKDRNGATQWFKFNYSEERRVPEGCDLEKEKQALWNDVNRTVDQQLDDALNYMESK